MKNNEFEMPEELTKEDRRQFGVLCGQLFKKPEEKPREKTPKHMKVVVRHLRSYGNNRFFPKNRIAKKLLEFIAFSPKDNRKTFCEAQLQIARVLGFDIVIEPTPLKLGIE
jgi:hypothetical protein